MPTTPMRAVSCGRVAPVPGGLRLQATKTFCGTATAGRPGHRRFRRLLGSTGVPEGGTPPAERAAPEPRRRRAWTRGTGAVPTERATGRTY